MKADVAACAALSKYITVQGECFKAEVKEDESSDEERNGGEETT